MQGVEGVLTWALCLFGSSYCFPPFSCSPEGSSSIFYALLGFIVSNADLMSAPLKVLFSHISSHLEFSNLLKALSVSFSLFCFSSSVSYQLICYPVFILPVLYPKESSSCISPMSPSRLLSFFRFQGQLFGLHLSFLILRQII